jgi:hypothetical protein
MDVVEKKFGAYDHVHSLSELLELRQSGTVEEFVTEFESLQFMTEMHNTGYDKLFFITQFTRNLKPKIAVVVQSQIPQTMEHAIRIAKVQEQLIDRQKFRGHRQISGPKNYGGTLSKYEQKSAPPVSSLLSKQRQKREYCKANNLCFYCSEPFDAAHLAKCTKRPRSQVNALVVNDLDVNLTEEVLEQLDLEEQLNAEFHHLSLNAVTGTDEGDALKLKSMVHNKVMLILVDSGSSHSFVSSSFIQKCGISTSSMKPSQVKVANGEILISDKVVKDMEWWIQGHTFHTDMKVLDLGPFDAILGYDWLKSHNPMACHWENRTLSIDHQGRQVFLQGVQPSPPALLEISSS